MTTSPSKKRAAVVALLLALGCARARDESLGNPCPTLPKLNGICFGITFDSLKSMRPGLFRDSDGVRERLSDSTDVLYYFSPEEGSGNEALVGLRLEMPWPDSSRSTQATLRASLQIGMQSIDSGMVRFRDPWVGDSVDVFGYRFRSNRLETLVRWDVLNPKVHRQKVYVWAHRLGRAPVALGRWIE